MAAKTHYDVIVLGLGAMGGAALYTLAKRGHRVCGVEQHHIAHDLGSSHGTLRMIRRAYFEHPAYMPLLNRAYDLWKDLEDEAGVSLLTEHGLMISGAPDSDTIRGLETCYAQNPIPHERISADEARHRFPALHPPDGHIVYCDPSGGYLYAERSAERQIELAERHGARVHLHETVLDWKADGDTVSVTTDQRDLAASRLV
ncbi:MAG: FAD-dependent oxidoreductase, partial [Candidatus Hydrogenedentes bacterium]|nr:FAD-dependent oxidoreductase [Candidatus Hydrogenedentota bacterium]